MKYKHTITTKWSDVDPMYFVRTEIYIDYYREASSGLMKAAGYPYMRLEEKGIQFPILEVHAHYKKPLRYDRTITIETWISKLKNYQMVVQYQIIDHEGDAASNCKIVYGVLAKETEEPCPMPEELKEKLAAYVIKESIQ